MPGNYRVHMRLSGVQELDISNIIEIVFDNKILKDVILNKHHNVSFDILIDERHPRVFLRQKKSFKVLGD